MIQELRKGQGLTQEQLAQNAAQLKQLQELTINRRLDFQLEK